MPTKIPWASETWNVVTGCTPTSEGCQKCYAKKMASRLAGRYGYDKEEPFKSTFHADKLDEPDGWHMPRKIFVSSMGDIFHKDVPDEWIIQVFDVMYKLPRHTFMVLTKRPERMRDFICGDVMSFWMARYNIQDPLHNVWLGVTAENQKRANERIPVLLEIPAAIRFVSIEPMLEWINLGCTCWFSLNSGPHGECETCGKPRWLGGGFLSWIVLGAESGPGARYMDPQWARYTKAQCDETSTPFFMKQMSNKEPIPEDLMVRVWPDVNG